MFQGVAEGGPSQEIAIPVAVEGKNEKFVAGYNAALEEHGPAVQVLQTEKDQLQTEYDQLPHLVHAKFSSKRKILNEF